jgi:DNA repair exonuclease SbcCD ATPase subunit
MPGLGDLQSKVAAFDKTQKLADLKKQAADSAALTKTANDKLAEVNASKAKMSDPLGPQLEAELDRAHQQLTIARKSLEDAKAAQAGVPAAVSTAEGSAKKVSDAKDAGKPANEVFKESIQLGKDASKVRSGVVNSADAMVAAADAAKKANDATKKVAALSITGSRPVPDPAMTALTGQNAATEAALHAADKPIKDAKAEADKTTFKAAMKKQPGNVNKTPEELATEASDFAKQAKLAEAALGDPGGGALKDLEDAVKAAEASLAQAKAVAGDYGATTDDRAKAAKDAVLASRAADAAAEAARKACEEACKSVQELDALTKDADAVIAAAEAAKTAAKLDDAQQALNAADAARKKLSEEAAQKALALEARKAQAAEARRKADEAVEAARKALAALNAAKSKADKPLGTGACGAPPPPVPGKQSKDLTEAIKALADLQKTVDALTKELAALEDQAKDAAAKLPALENTLSEARKKFEEAEAERAAADKIKNELADARKELDAARKAVCDEADKAKDAAGKAKQAKDDVVGKRMQELRNEGHGPQRHADPDSQTTAARALHKTNPERMKPGATSVRNEEDPPASDLHKAADTATKFKSPDDYVLADANAREYFRAHNAPPPNNLTVPYAAALPGASPGTVVEGKQIKSGSTPIADLPVKGGGRHANPDFDDIDQTELAKEIAAHTEDIPAGDFQKGVFALYREENGKLKLRTMFPETK